MLNNYIWLKLLSKLFDVWTIQKLIVDTKFKFMSWSFSDAFWSIIVQKASNLELQTLAPYLDQYDF